MRGERVHERQELRRSGPLAAGGAIETQDGVRLGRARESGGNELAARARGADDAVFVTGDGLVLEGPVTNVWWRRGSTLFTPSLDLGILAGVTRQTVLDLAAGKGYETREGRYALADLVAADEAFTSSSVRELLPVVELDGHAIPRGEAAAALQAALREAALG